MLDATDLDPARPRRGSTLHEEEVTGGAVWITLHYHCPVLQVRKENRCNIDVILNQVSLSDSPFWPEQLVEVSELHHAIVYFDFEVLFALWEFYSWDVGGAFTSGV